MKVAIHQPNYIPWRGYFLKLALSDIFIFLDDAQYPKNSYVNRARVLENGKPVWLTIPARPKLGTPIHQVISKQADWPSRHLSRLFNSYKDAPCKAEVWSDIETMYEEAPVDSLSASNRHLIFHISVCLGFTTKFLLSSEMVVDGGKRADERLIDIVTVLGGSTYLSGQGGKKYQDLEKFGAAGIEVQFIALDDRPYQQASDAFHPGLSVLDAVFNLGWRGARAAILH